MKIIHIPYCFFPGPVGGTEVYVNELSKSLVHFGIESIIAVPGGEGDYSYTHQGVKVRRFDISKKSKSLSSLYGDSDPIAVKSFAKILDEEKPDIVHMHSLTYASSPGLAAESKKRGLAVVFSYHTPSVSCQTGSLVTWKKEICKGLLDARSCSVCAICRHNIPGFMARLLADTPTFLSRLIERGRLNGRLFTAIRMRSLVGRRILLLGDFFKDVDCVIALNEWSGELLSNNNIIKSKIALVRHGIYQNTGDKIKKNISAHTYRLKLAYMGRLDQAKGIDLVIRAFSLLGNEPMDLDIYGIVQDETSGKFAAKIRAIASSDSRIVFLPPVPYAETIDRLKNYHYLIVPSLCMETGPLVALEALASGTPVIGSNMGGIAEIIQDGRNGMLVEPGSARAWINVLRKVSRNRQLLVKLRQGIKPPRTMHEVAGETAAVYNNLAASRRSPQGNLC